ncbi:Precorrin-2 dehydrogenase [Staphylococcus aureus]|uniref:precorrin-2 dehydrogenase n=1 Tax=Staphylococcus aureus TaxID=1280 RepID=A0A380EQ10_STAAU|nr:Precorrin-2 dehydrogenase [Staphylococcus aureus]
MERKEFEPSDIVDAYLVIAATNEPRVNEAVKKALPEHALFNNVGDASNGNVVFPSALHRDKLTISVSTDGASPKLTNQLWQSLRRYIHHHTVRISTFIYLPTENKST